MWIHGGGAAVLRGLLLIAIAVGCLGAAPAASAAQRATLTWDTDSTDVDLHMWDEDGNHAWYVDQTGIPDAELSEDIVTGYGPESFEEFEGTEGRHYAYPVQRLTCRRRHGVMTAWANTR